MEKEKVDKQDFQRAIKDNDKDAIHKNLHCIGRIVSANLKLADEDSRHDIATDIYLLLVKKLTNYNKSLPNAFGYFYKIALREGWRLSECPAGTSDIDEEIAKSDVTHYLALEPIISPYNTNSYEIDFQKKKNPNKPRQSPVQILDLIIKKTRSQINNLCEGNYDYSYLQSGIDFLQQYRYQLIGEYYGMKLPDKIYRKRTIRTIAE